MLDELDFTRGAVASKDYVPALTHFHIRNNTIIGYNGAIAINAPLELDLNCSPKAVSFVKAIQACKGGTIQLHIAPNGKLAIRSGDFLVFIECIEEGYPDVKPEGEHIKFGASILDAMRTLEPFISIDASRPWSRGVLFKGDSAYATNNIILSEYRLTNKFPKELNVSAEAIQELLRIGREPETIQIADESVTFHFASGRWMKAQSLSTRWPDVSKILDRPYNPQKLPERFFTVLRDLLPFINEAEQVRFRDNKLATASVDDIGASVLFDGIPNGPIFNIKQLLLLEGIVTGIDFSLYPEPCLFSGKNIRGAIVGMIG